MTGGRARRDTMDEAAVAQMLARDRVEWDRLTALLDAHPGEVLHKTGAPWTGRDVYAHLTRWLVHSNANMEAHRAGLPISPAFDGDGAEAINSRWQKEDAVLTLAEARAKAFQAFEKREQILRSIRAGEWDSTLDRICHYDGSAHLEMHRGYISLG
jgi:hypothetical protein